MKILFHNYTTPFSTEARYLTAALASVGVQSELWGNPQVSAYDILDGYQPNVLVSHYKFLTNDIVKYLTNNGDIQLVINVTNADENAISAIESLSESADIPFLFTNSYAGGPKSNKLKIHNIMSAADIFLSKKSNPPQIKAGIIGSEITEEIQKATQTEDVYHLICLGEDDKFDLNSSVAQLSEIYTFYSKIILSGNIDLVSSQVFFDACVNSHDLNVVLNDDTQKQFDQFLLRVFQEPKAKRGDINLIDQMRSKIITQHTPFNRAERLAKLLKNEVVVKKLQNAQKSLVKS